jgi:hypothetical protein
MRISMLFAAGMVALSAVACGGSSEDGGGKGGNGSTTVNTSIPEGTKGSDLTQAQADELCDATAAAAKSAFSGPALQKAACGYAAFTQATFLQMPDKCQEFYDECLKAPQESDPTEDFGECTKPSGECTATVGEMEACVSDTFAQLKASLAAFPGCDDVGKDVGEPSIGNEAMPASCKVIEEKCPEALEETPSELPGGGAGADDNAPQVPGSNG